MKDIKFSRLYPSYHPLKGKPTHFIEKFWRSALEMNGSMPTSFFDYIDEYLELANTEKFLMAPVQTVVPKYHMIREGEYWKEGDMFLPQLWSGLPYRSKVLQFAPATKIEKIYPVEITIEDEELIYVKTTLPGQRDFVKFLSPEFVAFNDGLDPVAFFNWFKSIGNMRFVGQILSWNPDLNY
jgi:hypothetical protein